MNLFRAFVSRAAFAGFATVLFPMAIAAQQAPSGASDKGDGGLFDLSAIIFTALGYCFVGMGVGCSSRDKPEPVAIDMSRLGFVFLTIGLGIFIFGSC